MLKLTEAKLSFLENRQDGEEATWSKDEGGCKVDGLVRDAAMVPAAPPPQGAGEVRKSCRPGE
jgi:hypothetical protein